MANEVPRDAIASDSRNVTMTKTTPDRALPPLGALPLVRKPYYSSYGVELYLGNCAEFEFKYDLLVTDPPYGDGYKGGRTDKWALITGDDDLENIHDCLRHCLKGLRRGRHVYIFGGSLDLAKLPLCAAAELIWDKVNFGLGDLSMPWGPQHEKITFAVYEISKMNREKGFGNLTARLRKGSVYNEDSDSQRIAAKARAALAKAGAL